LSKENSKPVFFRRWALLVFLPFFFLLETEAQENFSDPPVPLPELGEGTYLSFQGGLYPDGTNRMPDAHALEGGRRAAMIQPLDTSGNPDPAGKIVLLSIGMSNTAQEFCGKGRGLLACESWSFAGQALADPAVDHTDLVLVNGAMPGRTAERWIAYPSPDYTFILKDMLASQGLSASQVQVIWLKLARSHPQVSLPAPGADAYRLLESLGEVVRTLDKVFPNLQMVFLSSRIYGGYATTTLNPEPYAYESGFSVKWLIESQIRQMDTGETGDIAGNLDIHTTAPWLAWGPYLWADGDEGGNEGLAWLPQDFEADGTHPSQSGEEKVGAQLLEFFKTSPFTRGWFLVGEDEPAFQAAIPCAFLSHFCIY